MTEPLTPGQKFRRAVEDNHPLQVVGAVTANSAIIAEKVGHKALYLSGGGVAASSLGIPDLGITTLHDVVEDIKRITAVTTLPLLVDIDTGWGALSILPVPLVKSFKQGRVVFILKIKSCKSAAVIALIKPL